MGEALPGSAVVALDVLLCVGVLAGALVTLLAPRRATGTLGFLVLGLLLVVVWARLGAPDVALAEAAIASGVTGALLLAAVTEHPRGLAEDTRLGALAAQVGTVLLATGATAHAAHLALTGPRVVTLLGDAVAARLDDAVVTHPVTAVLLDLRAYDTLLEIGVLAAAVLVAVAVRGDDPWWRDAPGAGLPTALERRPTVVGLVRLLTPLLVLLAAWLLVAGSTRPGGAFQAGAVVTGALLLAHLTGLVRLPTGGRLAVVALGGVPAFVLVGLGTRLAGRGWLDVASPWGGTVVVALEAVLAVGIGVGLAVLLLAAAAPRTAEEGAR